MNDITENMKVGLPHLLNPPDIEQLNVDKLAPYGNTPYVLDLKKRIDATLENLRKEVQNANLEGKKRSNTDYQLAIANVYTAQAKLWFLYSQSLMFQGMIPLDSGNQNQYMLGSFLRHDHSKNEPTCTEQTAEPVPQSHENNAEGNQPRHQERLFPQVIGARARRIFHMYIKLLLLLLLFDAGGEFYVVGIIGLLLYTNGFFDSLIVYLSSVNHHQPYEYTVAQLRRWNEQRYNSTRYSNQPTSQGSELLSSERLLGVRNRAAGNEQTAEDIPSYASRCIYQSIVMFFMTLLPSWNPDPAYLVDYEGDASVLSTNLKENEAEKSLHDKENDTTTNENDNSSSLLDETPAPIEYTSAHIQKNDIPDHIISYNKEGMAVNNKEDIYFTDENQKENLSTNCAATDKFDIGDDLDISDEAQK